MAAFPHLFSPLRLGELELANRIVMAPMTRNRADAAGVPTELMVAHYAQRADAGLIVAEGAWPSATGQAYCRQPGIATPAQVAGWRKLTDAVHARGGRIVLQIMHAGRIGSRHVKGDGADTVAPSAIRAAGEVFTDSAGMQPYDTPHALSTDEVRAVVAEYRKAAENAKAAGFDGVEIHGANGYLLDQFLKTGANQRTDDYGGKIENRARLMLEVTRAVVDAVGHDRVGIRLSPVTPANGIDDAEPQPLFDYLIRQLAPLGLAYIHVIEGATGGPREVPGRPFDYAAMEAAYRQAGGRGAWMVNNGYDPVLAEDAVASGRADLVAFGKAFISMPDLAARIRHGGPYQGLDKATMYGGGAQGYTDYPTLGG